MSKNTDKDFFEKLDNNFLGPEYEYDGTVSSFLIKIIIYLITFVGFLAYCNWFFGLDIITPYEKLLLPFGDLFYKLISVFFILCAVGGMIYFPFFILALIKTLLN